MAFLHARARQHARRTRFAGAALAPASVALALAIVALLGGCGSGADTAPASGVTQPRFASAIQALCRAQGLAATADVAAARRVFSDDAHAFLHELADRVSEQDRDATARLLIAKNRVETALAATTPSGDEPPGERIVALIIATGDAGKTIGLSSPGC